MSQTNLASHGFDPLADSRVKQVGFYDVETYRGFSSDIAVIGFKPLDGPFKPFYDPIEFVKYIERTFQSIKLYGYNSGKYDTLVFLEALRKKQYPISIRNVIFSGSSINTLQMGNIIFKDLILSLGARYKLSTIARDFFGESKKDFDASNITEVTAEMVAYNEQDVILTEKLYKELNRIMGVPVATAASMSLNTFETHFRPDIKDICDKRGIRDSYKGGRVEIFKFRGNDITVYDVNSMYPFVMKEYPYPIGGLHRDKTIDKEGYSFAIVEVPKTYIPYLALKTESKLLFPTGKFHGYFTNFELRKAREQGAKINIVDSWVCDETAYLFADYINHFYNERLKAKANKEVSKDIMYKTLMNCLYGKFGQRQEKDNIFSIKKSYYLANRDKDPELKNAELVFDYVSTSGDMVLLKTRDFSETIYHDYIIASYVTAYARNRLYDFFVKAGEKNMYYCDTDSIFTSADLDNQCGSELGLIKKEKVYKDYVAVMPKLYRGIREDGKVDVKAKGFRSIDYRAFDDVEIGGARIWNMRQDFEESYRQPAGFREAARRSDSFFFVADRKKKLVADYDKRLRVDDIETAPLEVVL